MATIVFNDVNSHVLVFNNVDIYVRLFNNVYGHIMLLGKISWKWGKHLKSLFWIFINLGDVSLTTLNQLLSIEVRFQ